MKKQIKVHEDLGELICFALDKNCTDEKSYKQWQEYKEKMSIVKDDCGRYDVDQYETLGLIIFVKQLSIENYADMDATEIVLMSIRSDLNERMHQILSSLRNLYEQ